MNVQIASSTDGRIAAIGPRAVHGAHHDAHAFEASGLKDIMDGISSIGDLGYVGVEGIDIVPIKRAPKCELRPCDKQFNTSIAKIRSPQRASRRALQKLADDERGRRTLSRTHRQVQRNTPSDHRANILQSFCISFLVPLGLVVDVAELRVAVRMLGALNGLGFGLQSEPFAAQHIADRVGRYRVPCAWCQAGLSRSQARTC
jgi:hypothetical protein